MKTSIFKKNLAKAVIFFLWLLIALPPVTMAELSTNFDDTQDSGSSTVLYLLHLNPDQDWQTVICIMNLESKDAEIHVEAYDKDGNILDVDTSAIRIGADETKTIDMNTLPQNTETLKMESGAEITGTVVFKTAEGDEIAEIQAVKEMSQQVEFSVSEGEDKTICILNPNEINANVNVIALDKEGNETRNDFFQTLFPMESSMIALSDVFDSDILERISAVILEGGSRIIGIHIDKLQAEKRSVRRNSDYTFGHPSTTSQNYNCRYNVRTCANTSRYHTGVDYSSYSYGSDVISSNFGKIARIEYMGSNDHGMGNNIIIEHELTSGTKVYTSYSHLASFVSGLEVGDIVSKGQKIGVMGGSGDGNPNHWGVHLHFEIKDRAVTNNPSGTGLYWGYTPSNPDNYGYHDPNNYIGRVSVKSAETVTVNLTSPENGTFDRGQSVTVRWSTTGASDNDRMTISMKRYVEPYRSYDHPDGVNYIQFTDSATNNGHYDDVIPPEAAIASDWKFFVKHNDSDDYDKSVSTISITEPDVIPIGEATDNTDLIWTTGGNGNWSGQNSVSYYGGDAAQSARISHSQSSHVQTTLTGPGMLSFYWKVSSERSYDYLRFYTDGVEKDRISGDVNWQQKSYSVSSGTHTLKWAYTKDGSVNGGSDAGWIDKVEFDTTPDYTLNVRKGGNGSGSVTSNPSGISCGSDCSQSYSSGTTVILTATAAGNYDFAGWSGCNSTSGNRCTVILTQNKIVTATFNPEFSGYTLTVNRVGTGNGTVTVTPQGTDCGYQCWEYASGTNVRLTAAPSTGSVFKKWSGDYTGTASTFTIRMNEDKIVTAKFNDGMTIGEAVDKTDLTWTAGGNAEWFGQDSVFYYGGDAAQNGRISHNQASHAQTTVTGPGTLSFYWKVSSERSYDYLRFYMDGVEKDRISGDVNWQQKSYSVSSGTHMLKWAYTKDGSVNGGSDAGWLDRVESGTHSEYTLNVRKEGSGSGSVTSSPSGISCGSDCSQLYSSGSTVTLTAAATGNSVFGGWSGCNSISGNRCTVTMNQGKTVTARFNLPYGPIIASLSSTTNIPENIITINGNDFGTTRGSVYFGSAVASIRSWSNTRIEVYAPEGGGTVDVKITTSSGQQSNSKNFTYICPAQVSIYSGPGTVDENSSANYHARATYPDGRYRAVTSLAVWTVNPTTYAYMNSSVKGKLITREVPSDQTVIVTASYTCNGVPLNGNKSVTINDSLECVSVEMTGSPTVMNENSAYELNYEIMSTFSDGTRQEASSCFVIRSPSPYVETNGNIWTTKEVPSDQTVTLSASCGCGDDSLTITIKDVPDSEGSVVGYVRDYDSNLAIEGAQVRVGGQSASSNYYGYFSVSNIPVGSQTMVISHPDYAEYQDSVTVMADQWVYTGILYLNEITTVGSILFPDQNLEDAIREAIEKPTGDILASDLQELTILYAYRKSIRNIEGIQYCSSLASLYIWDNEIADISPLANLTRLSDLNISDNPITDISPLANLTNLGSLFLYGNSQNGYQISDISSLANLTNLVSLKLSNNQISDISPLMNLTRLSRLWLGGNPLNTTSCTVYIPQLAARGISVNGQNCP